MFKYMEQTRTFWFSHLSIELETEYRLVGSVLGLAIYNGVILDLHFPPVVYKKLLNGKPNFQVSSSCRHMWLICFLPRETVQSNVLFSNSLWLPRTPFSSVLC